MWSLRGTECMSNTLKLFVFCQGLIVDKMTGPKKKEYGGLLASKNFEILIVVDSCNQATDGGNEKGCSMSVYDLKVQYGVQLWLFLSCVMVSNMAIC